ncbi:MAG: epoxyqueuosine reductase QueH [Chloroflexota bacterium]
MHEEGKAILLHVCCAPCSTYTITQLRNQGFGVTGFWYNPNIQPWLEHEKRHESMVSYAEEIRLPMIRYEIYEMPLFLRAVVGKERFRQRCAICYRLRLEKTAAVAEEHGFDAITTTLLISPYQDQEMIQRTGEQIARQHGLEFHYENFRQGWSERGHMTRTHDLYRQQYCGCIYSEWERYNKAVLDDLLVSIEGPGDE